MGFRSTSYQLRVPTRNSGTIKAYIYPKGVITMYHPEKINPVPVMLDMEARQYIALNGRQAFLNLIESLPAKMRAAYNQALCRLDIKYGNKLAAIGPVETVINDAENIVKGV
jgi:hypothetical protein